MGGSVFTPRSDVGLVMVSERLAFIAQVLLCAPLHAASLAQRCPMVLEMDRAVAAKVLLWLKDSLPKADVSRMVHLEPNLLCVLTKEEHRTQAETTLSLLHATLPGAPIHLMCQEDPFFMFEDVSDALVELRDLWPADMLVSEALKDSEPQELVLAIRALSPQGAPKTM